MKFTEAKVSRYTKYNNIWRNMSTMTNLSNHLTFVGLRRQHLWWSWCGLWLDAPRNKENFSSLLPAYKGYTRVLSGSSYLYLTCQWRAKYNILWIIKSNGKMCDKMRQANFYNLRTLMKIFILLMSHRNISTWKEYLRREYQMAHREIVCMFETGSFFIRWQLSRR